MIYYEFDYKLPDDKYHRRYKVAQTKPLWIFLYDFVKNFPNYEELSVRTIYDNGKVSREF